MKRELLGSARIFSTKISILLGTVMLAQASLAQVNRSYVPSNTDRTREIFVIYNGSNSHLVNDYIQLLKRKNPSLPEDQKIRLTVFVDKTRATELDRLVPSEIAGSVKKSVVDEAIEDVGGATDWLQDAGEFIYDQKGVPYFLKHKESPQFDLAGYLARERKIGTVVVNGQKNEMVSIEGGNIEGMPGGSVYVGENLDPQMIKALSNVVGANRVVKVPTEFSSVGHVDESFQFIPAAPDKSNQCGYALAYTDFLDGMRIAMTFDLYGSVDEGRDVPNRPVGKAEYLDAISYFTGVKPEAVTFTREYFYSLLQSFNFSKPLRTFESIYAFRKEDIYVYKAFMAQKHILQGLAILKAQAAKDGCAKLATVGLPALWTFGFNSDVAFPESQDLIVNQPISNLTAFTNLVVVNDAVLIPDAKVPSQLLVLHSEEEFARIGAKFKEIISTRLQGVGFKPEDIIFTDVAGAILGDGAAHCKSNLLRARK